MLVPAVVEIFSLSAGFREMQCFIHWLENLHAKPTRKLST